MQKKNGIGRERRINGISSGISGGAEYRKEGADGNRGKRGSGGMRHEGGAGDKQRKGANSGIQRQGDAQETLRKPNTGGTRHEGKAAGKQNKGNTGYRQKNSATGIGKAEAEQAAYRRGMHREEKPHRGQTTKGDGICPVNHRCGGCQYLHIPYEKQLSIKQKEMENLLGKFCRLHPIIGMENPYHYRNKVHAVFDHDKKGNPVSGVYEAGSHRVVPVESCMIEDEKADEIIGTIRGMLKSFKIRTYDEDTGYGLLRHVLVKRGFSTGEIMVVLVTASPVFPSRNNFVRALLEKHPEITTIIQNINGRGTSMVLGNQEKVLYGKGYIEDCLCGCTFRISSRSFYQINPVQTEKLYKKALELAGLTGKERVIDAYCGIGTIGIIAAKQAKEVIGVEQNSDAVRDAISNAKRNHIENIRFFTADASEFMKDIASQGEQVDVVLMDPPRSGSTRTFMDAVAALKPRRVVYISCGPETLARDLEYFCRKGFQVKDGWAVDLFPMTRHVETAVLLVRKS